MEIGYHASHEQFAPDVLLDLVQRAEAAGFAAAMGSDHFHPWSDAQGQSGFAWAWSGAVLARTSVSLGTVNCPFGRYHPAVIAQAAATLDRMFPGRFWLAVGSGEALNEAVTGRRWPRKARRNAMLRESVDVIRALWRGEAVDHHGAVVVQDARLYTRPAGPIPLYAAALTPDTARWAGEWADGLITVSGARETMRAVIDAFRDGGGDGKPLLLQSKHAYAATEATALKGAMDQWRTNVLPPQANARLRTPAQFMALGELVDEDRMRRSVRISCDPSRHAAWLQEDAEMGFDRVYVHVVNRGQAEAIDAFGEHVLPALR